MKHQIGVMGLGKLGSCLAAILATEHAVIGYDVNPAALRAISAGAAPVPEPGLAELMAKVAGFEHDGPYPSLTATDDPMDLRYCDVVFVVVPTPSTDTGAFDARFVLDAVTSLGEPQGEQVVVVVSTLTPGTCALAVREALPAGCSLVYCPAFIALGSVIHDFTHPDLILLGHDADTTDASALSVQAILMSVVQTAPQIHHMGLTEAELTKLSLNVALSVKIALANEVAAVAGRLGARAGTVLDAVGADTRIGKKYLQSGGPAAGPCLPRDLRAFDQMAARLGRPARLAMAAERVHRAQVGRVLSDLLALAHHADASTVTIGILGLAYKPGTPVTDASLGMAVAELAVKSGHCVVVHDPAADRTPDGVAVRCDTAEGVLDYADVILVATAWPEYADLDYGAAPVLDVWA